MHGLLAGFEFILRGGFMMYPLLLSALLALTVIIERYFVFRQKYPTSRQLISEILEEIKKGKISQAKQLCQRTQLTPVLAVLNAGIEHLENSPEEMEIAMKNRAEEWMPLLEKRIEIVDTVITAAPLMGLLGTITGMMASFQVLSEKGVNEPNAITGGVAEALIATATGLVIALFCLVAYNYFSSKVKIFIYEMEGVASKLSEIRMSLQRGRQTK